MMTLEQSGAHVAPDETDLRILFVVDSRFPGLGGAEVQAMKLAQGLKSRGIHVEYLAPSVIAGEYQESELGGIPITLIDYPHIKLLGSVVLMFKFGQFLIKHRGEFDCMHIHVTRLLAATAGVVRPWSRIPILTKISGFFEFEGGVLDQSKRHNPINAIMRLAMRNIDYVQTISKQTREKLIEAGFRADQIALIPNGIDTTTAPIAKPKSDLFSVGYCGRFREVKGVHILLESFAQSKRDRPNMNMRIMLAGFGSFEPELRALVKKHGIGDDVEFLGLISETAGFYAGLDLYVQPSFAEGLPNSVIEAMHAAKAVVASDIGGNHDLIKDNVSGHLFPVGDTDALSKLLIKCYDNRQDNFRMGKNGRQCIEEQYGMEGVIDQLVEIYSA